MNRPPPYFPQNQLSPPDDKRYKKFKLIVASAGIGLFVVLVALIYGAVRLIGYLAG